MQNHPINNAKLGLFVIAGLVFIILLLYFIGKNQHLFGSSFNLKVELVDAQGLKAGNNVRYAGIDIGTVKSVEITNDTTVEVILVIDKELKKIIRKNAVVAIKTDGLVGNKVVEISPVRDHASTVEEGDVLEAKTPVDTDEMLRTLSKTNNDLAEISREIKNTIIRINSSKGLWKLLNEETLPQNLKQSAANIRAATNKANQMMRDLHNVVRGIEDGNGSLGVLLKDTGFVHNLNTAVLKIQRVGENADTLSNQVNEMVKELRLDINKGKGAVHAVLKDSVMVNRLNKTLENIQQGTDGFNQNMEALKHNFFFRGYFRKQEKEKQKKKQ